MKAMILPSPLGYHLYDLCVNGKKEIEGETFAVVVGVRDSLLGFTWGAIMEYDEIAYNIRKES